MKFRNVNSASSARLLQVPPSSSGQTASMRQLDRRAGGFRVGPYGLVVPLSVRYVPGTMIVETTWMTPSGWLVVRDGLTIGPWHAGHSDETSHTRPPTDQDADHMLVRMLECTQGQVQVEAVCEPMFDYGRTPARWEMAAGDWSTADATDGMTARTVRRQQ